MKKWLKRTLFISLFSSCFITAACNNNSLKSENPYKKLIVKDKEINTSLKEFSEKYFFKNAPNVANDFYLKQLNPDNKIYSEVNISLTFAPLYIPKVVDIATEFTQRQSIRSTRIIQEILNNNWFWYLNNYKSFTYIFNNWRSDFKDFKDTNNKDNLKDQNTFNQLIKAKKLIKKFANYNIVDFSQEYPIRRIKSDKYQNLRLVFFKLENDVHNIALIPVFLYQQNSNDTKILLTGDIFDIEKPIDKIENIYKILSDEISNGREYFLNLTLEYQKKIHDQEVSKLNEQINKIKDEQSKKTQEMQNNLNKPDQNKKDINDSDDETDDEKEDEENTDDFPEVTLEELTEELQDSENRFEKVKSNFETRFNDVALLNVYNKNSYINSFYYAISKINEKLKDNSIKRYTWGYIDEKEI